MYKNVIIAVLGLGVIGLAFMLSQKPPALPTIPAPAQEEQAAVEPKDDSVMCAQVITPARDPKTGNIREFPTPCDVPDGWEVIQNDVPDLELNVQ